MLFVLKQFIHYFLGMPIMTLLGARCSHLPKGFEMKFKVNDLVVMHTGLGAIPFRVVVIGAVHETYGIVDAVLYAQRPRRNLHTQWIKGALLYTPTDAQRWVFQAAVYEIALTVHDEPITYAPDTPECGYSELASIMSETPPWAPGLPLAAGGFDGYRYRK